MDFEDIRKYTRGASYQITVMWRYLEEQLLNYARPPYPVDLDPDFQRAHVWTEAQQRRYVEFCLRGGASSRDILFNCTGWMADFRGPFVLVDGKQRLEAVRRFMRDDLAIFDGHRISDFTGYLRDHHACFTFHINDLQTKAEVLQWYLDLNSGGVVHTNEELAKVRVLLENAASTL